MPDVRVQRVGDEILVNLPASRTSVIDTDIAALASGGFVIGWHNSYVFGTSSQWIDGRVYTSSGTPVPVPGLGQPTVFTISHASYSRDPGLAPLRDGGFVATYSLNENVTFSTQPDDVYHRRYSPTGAALEAAVRDNAHSVPGFQTDPAIAVLRSGAIVVVWNDGGDLNPAIHRVGDIKMQLYTAGGERIGDERLVHTADAQAQEAPAVSELADGGFVIVWQHNEGTSSTPDHVIRGQRFDATGAAVGDAFSVNSVTAGTQQAASVASLPSGGFVVAWNSNALNPDLAMSVAADVKAQLFDADGAKIGDEFLVGTAIANAQLAPQVHILPRGGFVITWQDNSSGAGFDIKAQVFAEDGTAIGDDFVVNATTVNAQFSPSVAALSDGSLVFTWANEMTNVQYGAEVRAQRFEWITSYAGTSGDDVLGGSLSNDTFTPGAGVDHLRGFAGSDLVVYSDIVSDMEINLAAGWSWDGATMDFLKSIEDAVGGSGSDYLTGDGGDNVLSGGAGGTDFIHGVGGNDTASYASSASGVNIYLDRQDSWDGITMDFMSSIENAIGSQFSDYIVGDSGDNLLDGGTGGTDFLHGGAGIDTASYTHSVQGVQIYLDQQHSWDGVTMDFFSSIERGVGSAFGDLLVGSTNADRLNGWKGSDDLIGGAGADVFEFGGVDGTMLLGHDRVLDFELGSDRIFIDAGVGAIDSFADVLANAFQSGSDTIIQLNSESSVRLVGVDLASLTANEFMFG